MAKTIYMTVCTKGDPFDVHEKKSFFNASAYNKYVNSKEFKEKYPEDKFRITRELY